MKIAPIKSYGQNINQNKPAKNNVSFGDIEPLGCSYEHPTFLFRTPSKIWGLNHALRFMDDNNFFSVENKSKRSYGTRFVLTPNDPLYKNLKIIMQPKSHIISQMGKVKYYIDEFEDRGHMPKTAQRQRSTTEEFKNLAPENTVEQTSNMYTDRETNTTVFGKESLKQYEEFKRDYRIMANDIIVYSEQPESKDIDEKN